MKHNGFCMKWTAAWGRETALIVLGLGLAGCEPKKIAAPQSTAPATNSPASRTNVAAPAVETDSVQVGPFNETADAGKDLQAALARAKQDGKRVIVDFGANWCPDCVVLSRIFENPAVKPYLDANFHLVKVNVGRKDSNMALVEQYGNPIAKGIPAVVVLDADGQVHAATNGGELANARTATPEDILGFLKKWAPKRS